MSDPLVRHLTALDDLDGAVAYARRSEAQAASIRRNPQAHIDALCEAGVLQKAGDWGHYFQPERKPLEPVYRVVQPHVHEWRVVGMDTTSADVFVRCECDLGGDHRVSNRLPIEVPE